MSSVVVSGIVLEKVPAALNSAVAALTPVVAVLK